VCTTNHEAFVPRFDLLLGKVGVVHEELHVLLGQLLTPCHAHSCCLQQQQQQQQQSASVELSRQAA